VVSDFNADRMSDILWRNSDIGNNILWQMDGFAEVASASIGTVPLDWHVVDLDDFDGGGAADILWRNSSTGNTLIRQMNGLARDLADSIGVVDPAWQAP
jgi:hypothetical protein